MTIRLITHYYRNPSILQISFLFFAYQLLLILLMLIGGTCLLVPAFRLGKKISQRITDGKTLLTVCVKLGLCEIAAKSHLVFTRLSPCSALMHLSMLSPRGGTPGICGAFDFSEDFLVKVPTVGPQNWVK